MLRNGSGMNANGTSVSWALQTVSQFYESQYQICDRIHFCGLICLHIGTNGIGTQLFLKYDIRIETYRGVHLRNYP